MGFQVLDIIRTITRDKERAHRHPTFALDIEVKNRYIGTATDLDSDIRQLISDGFIVIRRTLNYDAYELIK